jgi:hypothetical protein
MRDENEAGSLIAMPANSQPFRIMLVHNFYGSAAPSGENLAFIAERDLLRSRGHEVGEYVRHSDEIRNRGISGLCSAVSTIWNPAAARSATNSFFQRYLHVHNTFPLISPSVFRDCKRAVSVLTCNYGCIVRRFPCGMAESVRL